MLDWRKDKSSGKFASARKEHFEKLRAEFARAGFKKELLVGDDFCSRLIQAIMKPASGEGAETSFQPFVGKLEVTPQFQLNGNIRIDFSSDEIRGVRSQYTGWFSLNPRKFSAAWLQRAAQQHVHVSQVGRTDMELDDGNNFDSVFFLKIQYQSLASANFESLEDAQKLFAKILAVLAGRLNE